MKRLQRLLGNAPLFLPVLAVAIVLTSVLVAGKVRPVVGARLRGGPTEGARTLSYRLELVERLGDAERPVPNRAVAIDATLAGGETLAFRGETDDEGAAAVALVSGHGVSGPLHVRATVSGVPGAVLDGPIALSVAEWASGARRRGGWVDGREVSGLRVRAAAGRGVFAVPFADPLWVDARRAGSRFQGTVTCDCAAGAAEPAGSVQLYPERDRTLPLERMIRPIEHNASVSLLAKDRDGTTASLEVSLAVAPGALRATLIAQGVLVESPILRDRAYVAVVTETARIGGGTALLHPTPQGTAEGVLALPLPEQGSLWAVVSSEPDLQSGSLVGWPLRFEAGGDPPKTFDVPDVLLRDTVGERVHRELGRARRARLYSGLFAGAALLLTALLVARRARAAQATLEAHLDREGADREMTSRVATSGSGALGGVLVAVLCLALAATLVGFFAALR